MEILTKFRFHKAIEAEVIKSETEKVEISAPQSIIDEILVENDGGKLHIHYKPGSE